MKHWKSLWNQIMLKDELLIHKEHLTMALTKAKLVETIKNRTGFPKNKSSEIVETVLEIIKMSLES